MKQLSINKIIDALLVTMLVLSTGGLLFVFNRNISYGFFILLLIFSLVFGEKLKKSVFNASLFSYTCLLVLLVLNFSFNQNQSVNTYAFYALMMLSCCLILFHFHNNRSLADLVKNIYFIIKLVMFHALINFLIFFFVQDSLSVISSGDGERAYKTFANIFFFGGEKNDYGTFSLIGIQCARNQGLFWEPGVLQFFLNILFFLEAFILKRSRYILLLSAFLIITTYSTIGIAILLIQTLVFVLSEFRRNKILALILIILAIPVYSIFNANYNEKMEGDKVASSQKRIYDFVQPFEIAKDNPFFGIGLDAENFKNQRSRYSISSTKILGFDYKFDEGNEIVTNSITFLIASMGFPTAMFLLYLCFKQTIISHKKWLLVLIVFFSAISEPILLKPFLFLFIFSALYSIFYQATSHKHQVI